MTIHCPCCGHEITGPRVPLEALAAIPLQPQERKIVDELVRIYPRGTDIRGLTDSLYFDDPNGGPEDGAAVVRVRVTAVRKALRRYGWTIPSCLRGPGSHANYKLEPLQ